MTDTATETLPTVEELPSRMWEQLHKGIGSGLTVVRGGTEITRRKLCDHLASLTPLGVAITEPGVMRRSYSASGPDTQFRNLLGEIRYRVYARPRFLPIDVDDIAISDENVLILSGIVWAGITVSEGNPESSREDIRKSAVVDFYLPQSLPLPESEPLAWLHGGSW